MNKTVQQQLKPIISRKVMILCFIWTGLLALMDVPAATAREGSYPVSAVPYTAVQLLPGFWTPRIETNRTVTIGHNLKQEEKQGSLNGFRILAGQPKEKFHGRISGESDVYKTIEGMVYSLKMHPDPALEKRLETIINWIVGAQAADGYLIPHIQIAQPRYAHFTEETTRTCELYNMGHMIESAVAHYQATGRRNYLESAIKLADLIVQQFSDGGLEKPSGHPEIELALVRLYQATHNRAYLDLAATLVQRTERIATKGSNGKPAFGHDEAWGHAVAMLYLYSGATDVAMLTGNDVLLGRLERKWENMVGRKLYLTGNAGHRAHHEGFSSDYDLPNGLLAYNETCAAIANIFWNQRMFLAHGDAKYLDVLEQSLYNGFLTGVGLSGDRFFYPNPLESDGIHQFNCGLTERFTWTGCPCCAGNIVRFMPTIPGYAYATRADTLYVNLFMAGKAKVNVGGQDVHLQQETRYPWDGRIKLTLHPAKPAEFTLNIRIPGWARNVPLPSDLYRYEDAVKPEVKLTVNDQPVEIVLEKGFAVLNRHWKPGDVVTLELEMPVRRVVAHPAVLADRSRFAVERGPIVYCAEGVDNGGHAFEKLPRGNLKFKIQEKPDLLGGITMIRMTSADAANARSMIPYYAWCHRGANEMRVWFPCAPSGAARAQPQKQKPEFG